MTQIQQDVFSPGLSKKHIGIRSASERRVFEAKVSEIHYSLYKKKNYAETVPMMTRSTGSLNCLIDICIISAYFVIRHDDHRLPHPGGGKLFLSSSLFAKQVFL
ncbi:MAG: hypothetical protein D3914_09145 [Candidatus Electrothrix sp. LOE2]|nr:hypothetical protein [Candidatus Electrothrix sp. LOE2]